MNTLPDTSSFYLLHRHLAAEYIRTGKSEHYTSRPNKTTGVAAPDLVFKTEKYTLCLAFCALPLFV